MARTGAAIFFGDRDAEKAHLGQPLPQLAIVIRLAVEHDTDRLRRAFFAQEFPRLVAQLLLVVGEIEIHGVCLLLSFRGARTASELLCAIAHRRISM